ncbi:MAG: 1,4-dihydroxy-6-naphthoate synthase [Desulfobacterales bacterium]|nr:1,4-dihydroxy-6-naphthoate synthase [Desulfobacterales bacterium]
MTKLNLGFSSCPNDTFIFHAMLHGLIDTKGFQFMPHIHDVELLNQKAFSKELHISKLSFFAYLRLRNHYEILDSGAALGFGCGPMLVSKNEDLDFSKARIAIPGDNTTAYLLLKLWKPEINNVSVTRFDKILPGIQSGQYDAGLIIHEGRFIYPEYGCIKIVDLGEWWENETNCPIPLGCIAIRKDPNTIIHKEIIEKILKNSIFYAQKDRIASRKYVKSFAQEMDDNVINGHINLYVNDFTVSLGKQGYSAINKLEEMAKCRNIL